MVVIDALVAVIIFVITAKIASVRVRPHSNEDLKQGIVGSAGILIGGTFLYGILFHINELGKLSTAPKECERVLNGVKTDNIVIWEDYLRNIDHVTVYIDDDRKIVRITTGQ